VVRVKDDGAGIRPDLLERHLRFVRAIGRETLDRAQGGLGVGLTLVAGHWCHARRTVTAKSDGEAKGSESSCACR